MPKQQRENRTYTIGELAAAFGLTHRAIRFYEDAGLLAPAREGMNRIYDHRDHARLTLICRGKRLGFSLAEIRDFLNLYDADPAQIEQVRYGRDRCRERIAALERQLLDVQQTLGELREIERAFDEYLAEHGAGSPTRTGTRKQGGSA